MTNPPPFQPVDSYKQNSDARLIKVKPTPESGLTKFDHHITTKLFDTKAKRSRSSILTEISLEK